MRNHNIIIAVTKHWFEYYWTVLDQLPRPLVISHFSKHILIKFS